MENTVKTAIWVSGFGIVVLVFASMVFGAEGDDPIFRAMDDELARSMDKLVIEGMPPPHFLSYRIRDYESMAIEARYGALTQSERSHNRYLYIDLRVGDPSLDNTNFFATWRDIWNGREGVVEEDSYDGLRHQIWYHTDGAYKDALENLARKKAYLQAHPVKEEVPDFSTVEPVVYQGELAGLESDQVRWEDRVREAGRVFEEFALLQDWKIEYMAQAVNQWYVNSEGSRHRKGEVYCFL